MTPYSHKPSCPLLRFSHPLAEGLVGAWSLHERQGVAVRDVSGSGNDGQLTGVSTPPAWVEGPWGPHILLTNPSSNRHRITLSRAPVTGSAPRTVALLINPTQVSGNRLIEWGDPSVTFGRWTLCLANDKLRIELQAFSRTSTLALPAGQWSLVACAADGFSKHTVFINGQWEVLDTAVTLATEAGAPGTATIGGFEFGTGTLGYFVGAIAFAAVWRRALSVGEMACLMPELFEMLRPAPVTRVLLAGAAGPQTLAGVTLRQTAEAALPDRPASGGGIGLQVDMVAGDDGQYLARDIGSTPDPLHTRLMLNPASASGGQVVVLRGVDDGIEETFRIAFDAEARSVTITLATAQSLTASLPPHIGWHCIELMIDRAQGRATLWVNGLPADEATGDLESLTTRTIWIGGMFKDEDTVGSLYLDEWVIADGYIGPVSVEPRGLYADDPARWLVIYNAAATDSAAWAEAYRAARGVPFANLLGLDLPAEEQITAEQFEAMRDAIDDYLARHDPLHNVIGILCGHGVPGTCTRPDLAAESIVAQLHLIDGDSTPTANPLARTSLGDALIRPTTANLMGHRLTARIDGPSLNDSVALTSRAMAIADEGLAGDTAAPGGEATLWLDPYGPDEAAYEPRRQRMVAWADSIERQQLRLPLRLPSESGADEPRFDQISEDGFYIGWDQASPPAGFFGEPAGRRVLCHSLRFAGATCPTLRNEADGNWCMAALAAGYAAAAGVTRAVLPDAVVHVDALFEGLRLGWSLGEAWFAACPVLRQGLMLVGDPLITVPMPRQGWNVYGPFRSWAEADFSTPAAALREDERQWSIPPALRPAADQTGLYVIRRMDAMGRMEAGMRHVSAHHQGGSAVGPPHGPLWPSAPDWWARREGAGFAIAAAWARRFRDAGVDRVQLVEQVQGQPSQVVGDQPASPGERTMQWTRTPAGQPVRYLIVAISGSGASISSPWSAWMTNQPPSVAAITLL